MSVQQPHTPSRKVLLIDDDASLRRVTEYSLHSAGFQVLSAGDGKQGLASFQADHPQVVITDIQMPGMSGYEVLQQIKAARPETVVIVITAYSSVEKAVEAMKQGSKDRYFQDVEDDIKKLVPEGIVGRVPYKGDLYESIHQFIGGLRAGMGYCGAKDIETLKETGQFVKITASGINESHPHNVTITKESPNYSR